MRDASCGLRAIMIEDAKETGTMDSGLCPVASDLPGAGELHCILRFAAVGSGSGAV